eukprot:scaffold1405_cov142-Ochromonas_danica.AAC.2
MIRSVGILLEEIEQAAILLGEVQVRGHDALHALQRPHVSPAVLVVVLVVMVVVVLRGARGGEGRLGGEGLRAVKGGRVLQQERRPLRVFFHHVNHSLATFSNIIQ